MNFIFGLTIALVGQVDSERLPALTLEEIVDGNQQALGLIHQLELEMHNVRQNYLSGERYGEPTKSVWKWAHKGKFERLCYRDGSPPTEDGRPRDLYDWFIDGAEKKLLRNWDPDNPQSITPINQGTVVGGIYPDDGLAPTFDVTRFLLWTFSTDSSDERRTLQDFIAESSQAELVGQTQIDGHPVWHIRATHPGMNGQERKGFYFEFFIDPSVNFAVRRVIEHQASFQKEINGIQETYNLDITRTVKKFQSFAGGIFVPLNIESQTVRILLTRGER